MSSFKSLNLTPAEDHEIFIGKMISIPVMFVLVLGMFSHAIYFSTT